MTKEEQLKMTHYEDAGRIIQILKSYIEEMADDSERRYNVMLRIATDPYTKEGTKKMASEEAKKLFTAYYQAKQLKIRMNDLIAPWVMAEKELAHSFKGMDYDD